MGKKIKPFRCNDCDKGFETELSLWQHTTKKHPEKTMAKPKYVPLAGLSTGSKKVSEAVATEVKSKMHTDISKRMSCACGPHIDAIDCANARYGTTGQYDGDIEPCDCSCHSPGEDDAN